MKKNRIDLKKWSRIFLEEFKNIQKNTPFMGSSDVKWTERICSIIHNNVRKKIGYDLDCICKLNKEKSFRKEYMGIDITWIDENSLKIPDLIIELENDKDKDYLSYCFWKLHCQKCKSKILIAYPKNKEEMLEFIKKEFPLDEDEQVLLIFGTKYKGDFSPYLLIKENQIIPLKS